MNNNRLLVIGISLIYAIGTNAQKLTVESYKEQEIATEKKILSNAITYKDASITLKALHNLIALEGKTSVYKDSLAMFYYNNRKDLSAAILTSELVKEKPKDSILLEINAKSLKAIGKNEEAIESYKKLLDLTQSKMLGYELAYLQLKLKKVEEAKKTLDLTVTFDDIEGAKVTFPSIIKNQEPQNIPLNSVLYYLQGLVAYNMKDIDNAKALFQSALEIEPKFEFAQQNLIAIKSSKFKEKEEKEEKE